MQVFGFDRCEAAFRDVSVASGCYRRARRCPCYREAGRLPCYCVARRVPAFDDGRACWEPPAESMGDRRRVRSARSDATRIAPQRWPTLCPSSTGRYVPKSRHGAGKRQFVERYRSGTRIVQAPDIVQAVGCCTGSRHRSGYRMLYRQSDSVLLFG